MNKVIRERFRLQKAKTKHVKALVSLQLNLNEKARELQAKEYERRLSDLNGEAGRIKANQEKSISVEKFDGFINQINQKFDQIAKEIKTLSDASTKDAGKSEWKQYVPWFIATLMAALSLYLAYG